MSCSTNIFMFSSSLHFFKLKSGTGYPFTYFREKSKLVKGYPVPNLNQGFDEIEGHDAGKDKF